MELNYLWSRWRLGKYQWIHFTLYWTADYLSRLVFKLICGNCKLWLKTPHHWTFVKEIYRWPGDSPHQGPYHYTDAIMGAMMSQITNLTIVYSTVYSGADQGKHQSSASLAFVRGIHRGPVNSPHKWQVTRKMFPFDDVIMYAENAFMSWHHYPKYQFYPVQINSPRQYLLEIFQHLASKYEIKFELM